MRAGATAGNGGGAVVAAAVKPVYVGAVGVVGHPEQGQMELFKDGNDNYYAKDGLGVMYDLHVSDEQGTAEAAVRRNLLAGGYTHAIGRKVSPNAGGSLSAKPSDPNKGQAHVDALKNILAGFASGGLSAGDVERGIDDAERVLGQPGALADGPRANLKEFVRQGQAHLSQAASASSTTVKALADAIGHFDRSGHSAQARSQLNDALLAARNASKSGWTDATLANFKSYDKRASQRLWPSAPAKSSTDAVERFLGKVGVKPRDVQRAIATTINSSPVNQLVQPGKALVGSEGQAKTADIKRLVDRSLQSFVAKSYPAFRGKVSSIEQLAYYKGTAADALWGQLATVTVDSSSGRFTDARQLLSKDGRKQAEISKALNAPTQYGPGTMSTQQPAAAQQRKSDVDFAKNVSSALWPSTVEISLLDPDVNAAMTPPNALTKAIDSVNPISVVMAPIRKLLGTDDPLAPGSRATGVPRMVLSELNKSLVAAGGKAIQMDGKGVVALPNTAQGGEILALMFFTEAGFYGSQVEATFAGPDIAKLSRKLPLSPSFIKAYQAKSVHMSWEMGLQAVGNIAISLSGVGQSPGGSQAEPLLRENSAGGSRTKSSTNVRPNEVRNVEAPNTSGRVETPSKEGVRGETRLPQNKQAETKLNAGRPLSSQVYPNQSVQIRNGVNLATLGEFKLRSLEALSKSYGVPTEQLRVMVYMRHGESVANKGDTFAGGRLGLKTDRGWRPPPRDAFTSFPNGELMVPGGQIPLSQLGVEQARDGQSLIRQLRDAYNIQTLEISPVLRAQQTAQLATEGQAPFAKVVTLNAIAERGMGGNVHNPKKIAVGDGLQNIDLLLDRSSRGYIGGPKLAPDTNVIPRPGISNPNRPVEDTTGFESVGDFEGRQRWAFWRQSGGVASDIYLGNTLQISHQYSIAGQLKAIDPNIDTVALGHGIPNGQPLVVIMRVQPNGTGQPSLSVLEAGYYKGH